MKKTITSFILGIFITFSMNAQVRIDMGDLPGGELVSNSIIYFKFVPKADEDTAILLDVGFTLSPDTIIAWGDYSCQLRVREDLGYFDVRDQDGAGGDYVALDTIRWEFDLTYHVWIDIHFGGVVDAVSEYDVYVLPDGETDIKLIAENANFRTDESMLKFWTVLGQNDPGPGGTLEISDLQYVTSIEVPPNSIFELENNSSLSLLCYPNPAKNLLSVNYSIDNPSQTQFIIYDITGKKSKQLDMGSQTIGQHSVKIDVSDLCKGVYFGQLKTEEGLVTQKIIIN